jgi:Transposase DDE domain
MCTFAKAVQQIKGNLAQFVPENTIRQLCTTLDYRYRERTLTPVVTTYLFLQQILHGNAAASELRHLCHLDFTDSAYCQARQRLPFAFFCRLRRAVVGRGAAHDGVLPSERWHSHRLVLVDGTSFSMPDVPELQEEFGQPDGQADGCGFPTAHLLTLFDAHTGYLLEAFPAPLRTHDLPQAAKLQLQPGDLLVGDRAFCSFAHLALCRQRGWHALFRAHQRQIISFRPHRRHASPDAAPAQAKGLPRSRWLKSLGHHDQLVEYAKPSQRPQWLTAADYAALPATLTVREVRFRVRIPGRRPQEITLVTTLLDPWRYSKKALAKLYEARWQAEVNLRHVKTTLKMDVLHSQTFLGILKELQVFLIIYNLVRRVMVAAARRQRVAAARISFIDALRWLRTAHPGDPLPKLRVVPWRPYRYEPRVRKRRPKQYDLMRKPRQLLRDALSNKKRAA